jgi:predicted dienelactone hydrolase
VAENRIDRIRPDAPELAARGLNAVGVRTLQFVHVDRPDIVAIAAGERGARKDRRLTVEVWYPASGGPGRGAYEGVILRDGQQRVTLHGSAVRDATPLAGAGPFPLVVLSHGYPGNRYLMSHLGESLAARGHVVASIDHPDSTYDDKAHFGSTLVNRPFDQVFVHREIARLSVTDGHFLHGLADPERAGLVGYSMGGYGAVVTAGGRLTQSAVEADWSAPDGLLAVHRHGTPLQPELRDQPFSAVIAFAPWGMQRGLWDDEGLSGVRMPVFFIAGEVDDISGYDDGVRALYRGCVNAERALLTFLSANHNCGAPIPAPWESWTPVDHLDFVPFEHYADPVWDTVRMNNIAQHFAVAWFGLHLKGDRSMEPYLDLSGCSDEGVWDIGDDGMPGSRHSHWKGFARRMAAGLSFERARPSGRT